MISRDQVANLKKPIGEMIPEGQSMVSANESDSMAKVAKLMESSESGELLSQIPLRGNTDDIRYVVTGKGLARWALSGHPDEKAYGFSDMAHKFPAATPLENVTDIVANFGYVLVTNEDDKVVVGILSYTEVIRELAQ